MAASTPALDPSRLRALWALAAVLLALVLFFSALPTLSDAMRRYPVDGNLDWLGARSFVQGIDPYSPEGLKAMQRPTYGHPPTTVLWFVPLQRIDIGQLSLPMGVFTLLLLLLHTQLLASELKAPAPMATGVLAFSLMASTMCIQSHLHAGQVSEWIAFLYVLSWYFLRQRREVASGLMLGLACTLKLFPGVMVLFLLSARRWKGALAAAATYLVAALVVTVRFGIGCWREFLALQKPVADEWVGRVQNASLHGIVLRWFYPSCEAAVGAQSWLTTSLIALIGLLLLYAAFRVTRRQVQRGQLDVPFALATVLSLFLNVWVWEHYNVFYLLPMAVGLAALRDAPRRLQLVGGAMIVAAAALLWLDTSILRFIGLQQAFLKAHRGHLRLHLNEIGNSAPALLLMGVLGWLAAKERAPQ